MKQPTWDVAGPTLRDDYIAPPMNNQSCINSMTVLDMTWCEVGWSACRTAAASAAAAAGAAA